jgi:hypothetical protein
MERGKFTAPVVYVFSGKQANGENTGPRNDTVDADVAVKKLCDAYDVLCSEETMKYLRMLEKLGVLGNSKN